MAVDQEKTSNMGPPWCFIVLLAIQGLVPLPSRAMMVTGTIQLQSAKVFAHDREPQTEEDCMGIRFDLSTEMKLHIPATATMTCLETTEYAALERIGIPVYQFVKLVVVFQDCPEEVYMWKAEVRKMP